MIYYRYYTASVAEHVSMVRTIGLTEQEAILPNECTVARIDLAIAAWQSVGAADCSERCSQYNGTMQRRQYRSTVDKLNLPMATMF